MPFTLVLLIALGLGLALVVGVVVGFFVAALCCAAGEG